MEGYTWFGNNRQSLDPRAQRGSGGVGFLIKNKIIETYDVFVIDNQFEDTIWIKIQEKENNLNYIYLCSCYLPPECSTRGNKVQEFFDNLLSNIYILYDEAPLIICGDLNSRIGQHQDVNIEGFPKRTALDVQTNQHGKHLLNFLTDSTCCIVNGRVTAEQDNFTSIRSGRAVVDYIMTKCEDVGNIIEQKTHLISDIINDNQIPVTIAPTKIPDHSVLVCTLKLSSNLHPTHDGVREDQIVWEGEQLKRYRLNKLSDTFFESDHIRNVINNTITRINQAQINTEHITETYQNLIEGLHEKMDEVLDLKKVSQHKLKQKNPKYSKPFWNEELSLLWKEACKAEKEFLKSKGNRNHKNRLRTTYQNKRRTFDRAFRTAERRYNATRRENIEDLNQNNPKEFWKEVNRLGPQKNTQPDFRTKTENGSLETSPSKIKEKWKNDFEHLYNNPPGADFDDAYLESKIQENRERELLADHHIPDNASGTMFTTKEVKNMESLDETYLNLPITVEEVKCAIDKAKKGKAPGYDNIANEILKSPAMLHMLHEVFAFCFEHGMTPEQWSKSIISPIHKPGKDKNEPLSHRGISLMSATAKIFTSVINNRINQYLEINNLLCEEQNGFRSGRSCLDHIYTLTTTIKNRLNDKTPTYTCFVDMSKAFDSVTHELLWNTLLEFNITGKIYQL